MCAFGEMILYRYRTSRFFWSFLKAFFDIFWPAPNDKNYLCFVLDSYLDDGEWLWKSTDRARRLSSRWSSSNSVSPTLKIQRNSK